MLKRFFDIVLSMLGLFLLLPFLTIVSFLVIVTMGLPVFFIQERPGVNGKPFKIIKFRTMHNMKSKEKNLELQDKDRLTGIGIWLRSYSIDELPELWNVLKGEMSIVGPRPLLMEYLNLYTNEQARRMEVKPGITGWAQINGRNKISWEEKFKLDIWYIDNWSFWLDIKIIFFTIARVLLKSNISADGESTMYIFEGNKKLKNKK